MQSASRLCGGRHFTLLQAVESLVQPAAREQLPVGSTLANLAVVEYEYLRRPDDRAQPVRYGDRRSASHEHFERLLNRRLDLAIDRARRLVEDQERRIGRDGARERQQLALAHAHGRSAFAELVRVSAGK